MITPTHMVTAQTCYLVACVVAAHPPTAEEAAVAIIAALLPDLDSKASYIGRFAPHTSDWLERQFGHRSFTHSLLVQVVFGLLAWSFLPMGYALAIIVGWGSHTVADMMTASGVAWFWPARIRCVLPGNPAYRMETMKGGELAFLVILALLGVVMMPLAETGKGTAGLIRGAIGNLESVRTYYDKDKGDFRFSVTVEGRDNRNHDDISGTYPVIGPWGGAGLIIGTDSGPRSLCTGGNCDWYASHAALERGKAQRTTTTTIQAPLLSVAAILRTVEPLAKQGEVYLLGSALAEGIKPLPPTVEASGENVSFLYASPEHLATMRGRSLRSVDLVVQLRHEPNVKTPEIEQPKASDTAISPLLSRWLE